MRGGARLTRQGRSRLARPVVSESIAERYSRLAREGAGGRGVDVALRVLDVLLSGFFLLLSLPVTLLIAALVLATSGGPLFYRGERVGLGGSVFTMLKFRTLRRGAEARLGPYLGPELVERTRAETTRVGGWLRAAQLDEIPQLWNVLRGDMSLVGPRPIRPRFFEELALELPAYWQRLRDLDGREARPRPGVDRRPLGAALPAHPRCHRVASTPPIATPLSACPP